MDETKINNINNINKLSTEYECPADIVFIKIADLLLPATISMYWITPNIITLVSFTSRIVSYNFLVGGYGLFFLLFFYMSYIFDCLDGKLARKTGRASDMGDLYDHVSDIITSIFGFLIFIELSNQLLIGKLLIIGLSFISCSLMCLHFGAQEKYISSIGGNTSVALELLQFTCKYEKPEDIKKYLKKTKYAGVGTINIFISMLMFLFF